MILRPYQQNVIEDIKQQLHNGHKSVVAVLGCGSGKSVIAADIAKHATAKHNQVLFLVHRKELCEQIRQTFIKNNVDFNYCDILMIQTYRRHMDKYKQPKIILVDETHTNVKAYDKVFNEFTKSVKIGFTATPCRLNQGGLGDLYSSMVEGVSTKWLIENKYLAPYKYYSIKLADTSVLHTKNGEFDKAEVSQLMENGTIYGNTVEQWKKLANNKKTIVYCSSVKSSQETCQKFLDSGISAVHLDGTTPPHEREDIMRKFRSGEITVLCNCELFGVGLDVPTCECVVLLRPTQSLALFIQQSMRSMRYMEGKTAIIIDHVGNVYRHGLPDVERAWALESKAKQENTVKIKECKHCFAVYPPTLDKCPYCGEENHIVLKKKKNKIVEVDLQEIKRQEEIKNTEYSELKAQTFEDVIEIQKAKKYKFLWALIYCLNHNISIPKKYNYLIRRFIK